MRLPHCANFIQSTVDKFDDRKVQHDTGEYIGHYCSILSTFGMITEFNGIEKNPLNDSSGSLAQKKLRRDIFFGTQRMIPLPTGREINHA